VPVRSSKAAEISSAFFFGGALPVGISPLQWDVPQGGR
jgi:hypothetical protein